MKTKRHYEWAFEHSRPGEDDIEDVRFVDSLRDSPRHFYDPAQSEFGQVALGLVLDKANPETGASVDRAWAYVQTDGTLERYFRDAFGEKVLEVPQRFHSELRGFQRRTDPVFQVVRDKLGTIKVGDVIKLDGKERRIKSIEENSRFKIVRVEGSRKIGQLPKCHSGKFKRVMPYSVHP